MTTSLRAALILEELYQLGLPRDTVEEASDDRIVIRFYTTSTHRLFSEILAERHFWLTRSKHRRPSLPMHYRWVRQPV